jgi:hypothetical protein
MALGDFFNETNIQQEPIPMFVPLNQSNDLKDITCFPENITLVANLKTRERAYAIRDVDILCSKLGEIAFYPLVGFAFTLKYV